MTGRYYVFPLRLGKDGRSNLRRVPYGLRDTRLIFFNGIMFQNYTLPGKLFSYWFRFSSALKDGRFSMTFFRP